MAKKLHSRGLVQRSVHADDARVTQTAITELGVKLIQGLAPAHVESVRELIFDQLDCDDVADLARVGRKLVRGLDEQHWTLRPPAQP